MSKPSLASLLGAYKRSAQDLRAENARLKKDLQAALTPAPQPRAVNVTNAIRASEAILGRLARGFPDRLPYGEDYEAVTAALAAIAKAKP